MLDLKNKLRSATFLTQNQPQNDCGFCWKAKRLNNRDEVKLEITVLNVVNATLVCRLAEGGVRKPQEFPEFMLFSSLSSKNKMQLSTLVKDMDDRVIMPGFK
jgi:hypothetical protein